jgi:hypothetical protein
MNEMTFRRETAGFTEKAFLIAWDTCHKIYIALDEVEAKWFSDNYDEVFQGDSEEMLEKLWEWYSDSCGLRFVEAIEGDDEGTKFTTVIAQGV